MKYIKQFCVILGYSFIGEILNGLIPLPIPASIYGIILLFLCLEFNILPLSAVKDTGRFMLEIMPVMFIPAAVGLIGSWDIIKRSFLSYAAVTAVSTFTVMAVSGLVTQFILRKGGKKAENND